MSFVFATGRILVYKIDEELKNPPVYIVVYKLFNS